MLPGLAHRAQDQLTADSVGEVRDRFRSAFGSDPYPAVRARLLTEVRARSRHIQATTNYGIQELESGVGGSDPGWLQSDLERLSPQAEPVRGAGGEHCTRR